MQALCCSPLRAVRIITYPPPLNSDEVKATVLEALENTVSYQGSITATSSMRFASTQTEKDLDVEQSETPRERTSTGGTEGSYTESYNAQTGESYVKEYQSKFASWSGFQPDPDDPDDTGSGEDVSVLEGFSKVVKDGDWYYEYHYATKESPDLILKQSSKYPADTYNIYNDFNDGLSLDALKTMIPAWVEADSLATFSSVFHETFASDGDRALTVKAEQTADGALCLSVFAKASATVNDTEMENVRVRYTVESKGSVSVKEGRLHAASVSVVRDMTYLATMDDGETYLGIGSICTEETNSVSFTYAFDQADYDALLLTDAPDKDTIDVADTKNYKEYALVSGDYCYDNSIPFDYSQPVATQIANYKATLESMYGNDYDIVGYYVDKGLTTALTDEITAEEWAKLDTVYVKFAPIEGKTYLTKKVTFDCDPVWKYLFPLTDKVQSTHHAANYQTQVTAFYAEISADVEYYLDGEKVQPVDGYVAIPAGVHTFEERVKLVTAEQIMQELFGDFGA